MVPRMPPAYDPPVRAPLGWMGPSARWRSARRAACAAGCLAMALLAPAPVEAARTDVVGLRNGDRSTCELMGLERGRVRVKTDDMGTIDIEWDKVTRVTAARTFEVETSDGQRYIGALSSTADG